jgi:HipA-like protein
LSEHYAFVDGAIGDTFHKSTAGTIEFEYSSSNGPAPISLSLPRAARDAPGAAVAYLENLLPDNEDVRERWARQRALPDSEPFTLLCAYGEDVSGAVSLSTDQNLPDRGDETVVEATEDDVAERMASLRLTSPFEYQVDRSPGEARAFAGRDARKVHADQAANQMVLADERSPVVPHPQAALKKAQVH